MSKIVVVGAGKTGRGFIARLLQEAEKEILDEYKILYNKNKSLIGWIKIDDTNIDYPVMQTVNNEYYLDHNYNQQYILLFLVVHLFLHYY